MKILHWWVAGLCFLLGVVSAGPETGADSAYVLKLLDTGGEVISRPKSADGKHDYAFDVGKYEFAKEAQGFKLGAYAGMLKGQYVGPYYIKAKLKGAGGDFDLMFKVETQTTFKGKDGEKLPSMRDAPKGSQIEEMTVGWSVGLIGKVDKVKLVLPEIKEGNAVQGDLLVKASAKVRAEVDAMNLEMSEFGINVAERKLPSGWRERGWITVWKDSEGKVRRVKFWEYLDHLREKKLMHDVYFDSEGQPRVAIDISQWFYQEDEGRGDHEHKFWERTIFIDDDGSVGRVMEKTFHYVKRKSGRGLDEEILGNKEIFPEIDAKRRYVACARLMNSANPRMFLGLADQFRKASEELVKK